MKRQGTGNREKGKGNREQGTGRALVLASAAALISLGGVLVQKVSAQQIQLDGIDRSAQTKRQHVELLSDAVEARAGEAQVVELRFRVDPGFHINSHTPKDELLIPTELKLGDTAGVKVLAQEYPRGSMFRLQAGGGETLDVYQGEFRVRLRVIVPRGESTLSGTLRYQACDNAACFPPRLLPVKVMVTGK